MIRQHPDDPARPWEFLPARPQAAGDVSPAPVAEGPWHVGGTYYANAANADRARQVRDARRADLARRAATYPRRGA